MCSLEATRAELGLAVLYLNKAEARDKICRAIQYGSKFISNGQPGTAQNVDKSTTLARKVFRLLKVSSLTLTYTQTHLCIITSCSEQGAAPYVNLIFGLASINLQWVNDLHALISPPAKGTPLTLVLLGKVGTLFNHFTALISRERWCADRLLIVSATAVQECAAVDLPVPGPVRVDRKIRDIPGWLVAEIQASRPLTVHSIPSFIVRTYWLATCETFIYFFYLLLMV